MTDSRPAPGVLEKSEETQMRSKPLLTILVLAVIAGLPLLVPASPLQPSARDDRCLRVFVVSEGLVTCHKS
jgi:hypothetical protein